MNRRELASKLPASVVKIAPLGISKEALDAAETDDCIIYLKGEGNFRETLAPDYKENRKDMHRPYHIPTITQWLIDNYTCSVTDGMEVDDALGIAQSQSADGDTIIVEIPFRKRNKVYGVIDCYLFEEVTKNLFW